MNMLFILTNLGWIIKLSMYKKHGQNLKNITPARSHTLRKLDIIRNLPELITPRSNRNFKGKDRFGSRSLAIKVPKAESFMNRIDGTIDRVARSVSNSKVSMSYRNLVTEATINLELPKISSARLSDKNKSILVSPKYSSRYGGNTQSFAGGLIPVTSRNAPFEYSIELRTKEWRPSIYTKTPILKAISDNESIIQKINTAIREIDGVLKGLQQQEGDDCTQELSSEIREVRRKIREEQVISLESKPTDFLSRITTKIPQKSRNYMSEDELIERLRERIRKKKHTLLKIEKEKKSIQDLIDNQKKLIKNKQRVDLYYKVKYLLNKIEFSKEELHRTQKTNLFELNLSIKQITNLQNENAGLMKHFEDCAAFLQKSDICLRKYRDSAVENDDKIRYVIKTTERFLRKHNKEYYMKNIQFNQNKVGKVIDKLLETTQDERLGQRNSYLTAELNLHPTKDIGLDENIQSKSNNFDEIEEDEALDISKMVVELERSRRNSVAIENQHLKEYTAAINPVFEVLDSNHKRVEVSHPKESRRSLISKHRIEIDNLDTAPKQEEERINLKRKTSIKSKRYSSERITEEIMKDSSIKENESESLVIDTSDSKIRARNLSLRRRNKIRTESEATENELSLSEKQKKLTVPAVRHAKRLTSLTSNSKSPIMNLNETISEDFNEDVSNAEISVAKKLNSDLQMNVNNEDSYIQVYT